MPLLPHRASDVAIFELIDARVGNFENPLRMAGMLVKPTFELYGRETAPEGRKYALTTVRSRAARFHWPLSDDETEEPADAARPVAAIRRRQDYVRSCWETCSPFDIEPSC